MENSDLIREVYDLLKEFIALMVPLRNDPQRKMMMDGILLSIINSRYVYLYGLTKQRLNQIELTALKKVRLSGVAMELIEFAEDYEEAKNKIKEYRDWYLKHPCSYKK